jgi:DNA-binding transcriptional LysR family regulator
VNRMNLLHMKYACVIAETNSMTQAAEKLYTSQPNLSRAIRELESALGVTLFKRTSKGIYPTEEGSKFIERAKSVLSQVDDIQAMFSDERRTAARFSISVPRASYIASAFTEFVSKLDPALQAEIYYKETNSLRAISNIINEDYGLGILRFNTSYERYFRDTLDEKGLTSELVLEFERVLLISKDSPLASLEAITENDLAPLTEIAHSDPFVPSLPHNAVRNAELAGRATKHVFVFERASQLDLLSNIPSTFMWTSRVPAKTLERYNLVQRDVNITGRRYRDILIHKKDYHLSELDKSFIDELTDAKRAVCDRA